MLRMLLLFLTFTSVLSCKVGDESFIYNVESSTGGKWFLSTLSPATCSGSFDDYNISFSTNGLSSGSTYNVTLAIWKQVGSDTYEKDSATIQHYTYTHSNNRRRKRATLNTAPFSPAVGIRKGSLIGAYLYTSAKALPIIGRRTLSWFFIGACVSESPASTTTLTCNSENFMERNVLHAEADVVIVDCGAPPSVLNASYSQLDNDTQYGARVQYNCSTGYNINGNDIISCLLNASWSSPTPSCSIVNCGNPGEPANGYTNDNVFTYQSTVQYYCNVGYQLSGDSSIECTANGNWNNTLPNCAIINCTDPGTPTNGERTGVNIYYNSTVSYSCNTGYNLTGAASITCNATGLWSAPVPSCPPVSCGDPGTPNNGKKSSSVYTYNSIISFQCDSGYLLSGPVSLICLSNGLWNGPAPTCNPVNCGDPGTLTNGTRNGTVFTFNSTVLYSCDTGYTITGATSLTCLSNGLWDESVPSCDIVNCSSPGEPTNGMLQGGTFTYNSVVTYNCSVGYGLTGAVALTCLADGTWDASMPSCDIVNCSDPGIPINGERSFGSIFTYGAHLVYSCKDEYSIVGAQVITCQSNGSWSDTLPNCVYIDCTDPGIPDNGLRTSSNFSFNSSVNFTCYPGYQLTGSDVITCADGKWSDDIPSCNITYCSAPMSPANGNVSYTSLSVNSSVYFTCNTGYTLTGDTNITCLPNTQWSNVIPTCTVTVCPLTPPSHGYFTPNNNQYNYGTIVSVNCNPGYGLVGVSTLTCTATGQWSNNIPQCIATTLSSSFTSSSESSTLSQTTTSSMQSSPSLSSSSSSLNPPSTTRPTLSMSSVNSAATTQPTLSTSFTLMPTTSVDDSNDSLVIGGVIGAVLFILIILIVAILLIVLLVARSKRKSRKLNVPATTNLTNPILFSNLYNSMPNNSKAAPSEEHPDPDYDDPTLTLRHEPVPQTFTNLLYSELETLKTEDDSKYPSEDYDNENIANVVLPPPIHLDVDDDTEGVANSLYFIQEEAEEKAEEGAGAVYFTLDEDAATGSGDKNDLPVYFTLENERKTVPKFNGRKLAKRNTLAFIEPGESEDEIYGQIERSSNPMIHRDSLKLSTKIGSGQFGNVCKGQWKKPNGDTIDVAVKMLQDGASEQEKIKFLQEAAIMSQFTHANVIKLHGVVSDDEHPLIVIEYMPKGDLFGVLQKMRPDPGELIHHDTPALLLSFCQQVCLGMTYLSSKGFVHRDLAARNILVSADNICKIIDFGLSRDLEDENYYVSRKGAMIPVKWTAPEALNYRKYSTASDVWSYGCLMYEIWSIGRKPYEEDTNASALRKITSSERLPPPPGCPETIYSLMISCWHPVASERPNFHEIMVSLLQPNKNILTIPETALSSHPQAGSLGGTLKAGENMYPEIQHCYSDVMDTEL